jgi:hypothetical protein
LFQKKKLTDEGKAVIECEKRLKKFGLKDAEDVLDLEKRVKAHDECKLTM